MRILAIETSCDETAAAVIENGSHVVKSIIATSHEMYEKYGGIVPEVAARAQMSYIQPVIREALAPFIIPGVTLRQTIIDTIDAIAVTAGPGLIGSLLVGVETAKTIAATTGRPLIPVNHVLAHMYANFVDTNEKVLFPALSLVVSGGHTELYRMNSSSEIVWLGGTLDDAAGEAFDKTARLLGFGHQGGVAIQEAAARHKASGKPPIVKLPKPMLREENINNFSFSGLKTAIWREWNKLKVQDEAAADAVAFSVQETITDVLVEKTIRAAEEIGAASVLLSGGVSANLRLREKFLEKLSSLAIPLLVPPVALCTDNAAYIGSYAYFRGKPADWQSVTAVPDLSVEVQS